MQILPTKLLGIVTDHGDWPVERIAVGSGAAQLSIDTEEGNEDDEEWHGIGTAGRQTSGGAARVDGDGNDDSASPGRWWVGSVGHEDGLRLTDLMRFFRDGGNAETSAMGVENDSDVEDDNPEESAGEGDEKPGIEVDVQETEDEVEEERVHGPVKRKRKQERDPVETKKKKGKKNAVVVEDTSFFGDLV